jgi:hypothetical protein
MNAIQELFAPLDKDYCMLFYWLTVVNFIFLAVAALGFVSSLVLLFRGKITIMSGLYSFLMILVYALMYFQTRLFYSMCVTGNMKAGSGAYGMGSPSDSLPAVAKQASGAAPGAYRM